MGKFQRKYNRYNLSGEYGIGYTFKDEEFFFDLNDYDLIKDYCWHKSDKGYIQTNINGKTVKMHRLIMSNDCFIDHINHNTVDNRRCNLRCVTNQQNAMNEKLSKNNTSGVTGVVWHKRDSKWYARIKVNYKYLHLGQFEVFEDAVKARKEAEEKYFGKYSFDNSMSLNNRGDD